MSIFKCKMCGGTIEFEQGATVGVCDSCGTKQTLPRLDGDRKANLYDRANHFRRNNDFDKAMGIYEQILNEDNTDAEAYWSLVLCRYGIEYVEDPATRKRIPTVNRAQFTSVLADEDYKAALQYADGAQRHLYEAEAKAIDDIQKGILEISSKEEPFDVFICYKETDNNGRRTPDSVLANDLYHQLTQEGFKVFFSRITLEDKLGVAYEPYIFAALNSSKVMVALGTRPEYFNAVWVKNEWSRYLALIKNGAKKMLIPAYRDMDPYDLPEEFSHLQAQDMSKLGFMQDLIRGIKKIIAPETPKAAVQEAPAVNTAVNANVAPLLERVFLFLEDGKWQDANIYCEKVLDIDPRNAAAYLGKLMAELRVTNRKALADCAMPFDDRDNFAKVIRFGDEKLENEMRGYIDFINDRNETARKEGIYQKAYAAMNAAGSEMTYKSAADSFQSIPGYKDADTLAAECLEKAEVCRKNGIYNDGKASMKGVKVQSYENAIRSFQKIPGWRDADELVIACQRKIEEIQAKEEADRIERERRAEEERIAAELVAKKRKKTLAILLPSIAAVIAFVIVLFTVIMPAVNDNRAYKEAVALREKGQYSSAIGAFRALVGYKDSAVQIDACYYDKACELRDAGQYENAIMEFVKANGYGDSAEQITACKTALYNEGCALRDGGKYDEAIMVFKKVNEFSDSAGQIEACQTALKDIAYSEACALRDAGQYNEAIAAFETLNDYKDSEEQIENCYIGKYGEEKWTEFKNISIGSIYTFGNYEQDNNTNNGKEAIDWRVLAKEGDKLLLISEYALDAKPYNTEYTSVTWKTCSLRKWLNEDFINTAFGAEEQALIQTTTVTADKNPSYSTNPGNATEDKIFLLSIEEANKYFTSDEDRKCGMTDYAKAQGAYTRSDYKKGGKATCWWWLRSPGYGQRHAAIVRSGGSVDGYGDAVYLDGDCVRPALWINPES